MRRGKSSHGRENSDQSAFTLVEMLSAVLIFVMTIAAVFSVIETSRKAYQRGTRSMERYQSVRIGLDRFLKDVRSAVSPQSIWNNMPMTEQELEEAIDEAAYGDAYAEEPEEPEIFIRFMGTSSEVTFVVEEISRKRTERYFDLREIRYYVDSTQDTLMREIRDSVIRRRLNEFRAERAENESDFLAANAYAVDWDGTSETTVIAYCVKAMNLSYYDGEKIYESWDSEQEVEQETDEDDVEDYIVGGDRRYRDPNTGGWHYEDPRQGRVEKFGLPDAVCVILTLDNAAEVAGISEIPPRDFDLLIAINETAFGRRMLASRVKYNRENNEGPRAGRRAHEDRDSILDMLKAGRFSRSNLRRDIYADRQSRTSQATRRSYRSSRHTGRGRTGLTRTSRTRPSSRRSRSRSSYRR